MCPVERNDLIKLNKQVVQLTGDHRKKLEDETVEIFSLKQQPLTKTIHTMCVTAHRAFVRDDGKHKNEDTTYVYKIVSPQHLK